MALAETTRCAAPVFGCDETLIKVTVAGDLVVAVTSPATGPSLDRWLLFGFQARLYRSDARGTKGAGVPAKRANPADKAEPWTVSAKGLAAGHYLFEVYRDEGVSDFKATATLTPRK